MNTISIWHCVILWKCAFHKHWTEKEHWAIDNLLIVLYPFWFIFRNIVESYCCNYVSLKFHTNSHSFGNRIHSNSPHHRKHFLKSHTLFFLLNVVDSIELSYQFEQTSSWATNNTHTYTPHFQRTNLNGSI